MSKAFVKGIGPELNQDERLDILFYARVFSGLAIGVVAGLLGITGFSVLVVYGAVSLLGSTYYYSNYLDIEIEEDKQYEIQLEGTMQSVACFMLSWVLLYSYV